MTFRTRRILFIVFAACLFFCLSLCPRPAQAKMNMGWPVLGLDIGWEDMLLKGNDYKTNNHGLMFTRSLGWNMIPIHKHPVGLLGFQLDQDLGSIELRPRPDGNFTGELSASKEKRFKGATFVSVSDIMWFDIGDDGLMPPLLFQPKLGVGAVYMKTPHDSDKSFQSWFAIRPSVSINIWLAAVAIGLEFDYTLGISPPNVFDQQRLTHFVSAKFKVWI